jgi:hypothetical protein
MIQKKLVLDRLQYPIPGICAILTLIYLSPFVGAWLNYLAFSLCIYRLAKYDVRTFSIDYCCLISVAAVFVLPSGISFVVVLCLIAEVWFVIRDGLAINSALALLVLLVCYLLLRMQFAVSDFLLCVSQFIIIYLMLSFLDAQTIVLDIESFIINMVVSSAYALLLRKTPAITHMTGAEVAAYYGSSLTRFKGLFRDPNYYMSLVIMAIVLLTLLYIKKYTSRRAFLLSIACMLLFGALTYSKTFILLLGLYWLLCLFYLIRGKRYLLAFIYIFATAFLAVILSDTLFATTLYRLTSASSVRELTTGRSILLEMYGREIISSPDILLFGNGMSAQLLKKGTHNLFLEIQYYVGLTGLILYLLYFGILTAQVQKKYAAGNAAARLFSYAPLIVFIAAFCSLQGMFSVSVYTLLYLSIISIGIAQNDCTKGKGSLK